MTQQQALEVKDLAKLVVEALEVITEKECPKCNGLGWTPDAKLAGSSNIECTDCNGTGKVKWKWEPKVGEWCIHSNGEIGLIWAVEKTEKNISYFTLNVKYNLTGGWYVSQFKEVIPILHWEELERVLEGVDYCLELNKGFDSSKNITYWTAEIGYSLDHPKCMNDRWDSYRLCYGRGKSRQEAVMRAAIKLGEEKHES